MVYSSSSHGADLLRDGSPLAGSYAGLFNVASLYRFEGEPFWGSWKGKRI